MPKPVFQLYNNNIPKLNCNVVFHLLHLRSACLIWDFSFEILCISLFSFSVAQQSKSGLDASLLRFIGHTHLARPPTQKKHTHTHSVGLLWTSDQPVAEAATYATHRERSKGISLLSVGFEPAIPNIKRLRRYALDRAVTVIGIYFCLPFPNYVPSPAQRSDWMWLIWYRSQ